MRIHPYSEGKRRGIYVELESGWGEAAPLPGFSTETYEEALAQLQALPKVALFPSVAFALDTARHPIKNHKVEIAHFGDDGHYHDCMKLKLGPLSLEEAIASVKKAQCRLLRVDMNRQWPLEKAQALLDHFPLGTFEFVEEPTNELDKLQTEHPLAIDESFREKGYWIAAPYVVIKPTMMGGYDEIAPKLSEIGDAIPILSSSYETKIGIDGIVGLHKRLGLKHHHLGIGTL